MIKNFVSSIARGQVSDSWVSRYYKHNLKVKWNTAMDANRHTADSDAKSKLYFDLLQQKIALYDVDSEHTYNIDEKGFKIGIIGRLKRVFNREAWEKRKFKAALQDGNGEWVTLLACVCADGSVLPPGLIYQDANKAVQSSRVNDINPRKHSAHFTTSPSGWTNNDVE